MKTVLALAFVLGAVAIGRGVQAQTSPTTPAAPAAAAAPAPTLDDAYAPLKLYNGSWDVMSSDTSKGVQHLRNHCAQTGLFFMCEQELDGKTLALVCFLPIAKIAEGAQTYKTQVLTADATTPGDWSSLTIDGNRWVFSSQAAISGKRTYFQTVNTFTGNDKIHFEIQRSDDGKTWKTQESGDESRVVL